jgi:hypothetical protein
MANPNGDYSAKEVRLALKAAKGVVSQAAEALGCTPRTVYRYADRYVTVQEALNESRKDIAGEAEGYLVAMMRDREHPKHYKAVKDVLRNYHPDDWTDKQTETDVTSDGEQVKTIDFRPPKQDGDNDGGD